MWKAIVYYLLLLQAVEIDLFFWENKLSLKRRGLKENKRNF